jgi:hypothetical protein
MKRIYHHYEKWEDYLNGMWREVLKDEEEYYLTQAIEFTGNANLYGSWMLKVIEYWPFACEHNLTCTGMNRQAWIGHAAVSLAIDCPEYITRMAWWKLTEQQQIDANKKADEAIELWEQEYRKNGYTIIPRIFKRMVYKEVVLKQLPLKDDKTNNSKGVCRNEGNFPASSNQRYTPGLLFTECA